jgi:hypothetical protein
VDTWNAPPAAAERQSSNGQPDPERTADIANAVLDEVHNRVAAAHPQGVVTPHGTVGPTDTAVAPPTPASYPVVDPTMRVQEILEVRKNDKTRLQRWASLLGCTDLAHHRKWLAEWIVNATPGSGAIEPGSAPVAAPQAPASTGLPPAPAEPVGQSVVGAGTEHPIQSGIHAQQPDPGLDFTPDQVIRDIRSAQTLDVIGAIWQRWEATYGQGSWDTSGAVKEAADAQANFIRSQSAPASPQPGAAGAPAVPADDIPF